MVYKHRAGSGEGSNHEAVSEQDGSGEGADGLDSAETADIRDTGRELVAVEADDDAGETIDHGDDLAPITFHAEQNEAGYSKD